MHSPCARHSSRGKMDLYLKIVYRLPDKNTSKGFPDSSVGKESACNAEDPGLIAGSGRSAGEGISYPLQYSWASLVAQLVKNLPAIWETWVGKIACRRAWQLTPRFLPGKSHGQSSLVGYSPWGCKESYMTKAA